MHINIIKLNYFNFRFYLRNEKNILLHLKINIKIKKLSKGIPLACNYMYN